MSITSARILTAEHVPTISGKVSAAPLAPLSAPIGALRGAGLRTSLFQGCAYAEDPRDGRGYVFQLQAVRTGPGDVEDLRVHRFKMHPFATQPLLEYVATQTIVGGGHVQSAHVRISAQGNPYAWLGLEEYDRDGNQKGASLYRVRYRPDVWDLTSPTRVVKTSRKSSAVQRVYTGPGTVMAVGCPDWTIVLRRPGKAYDLYEWHQERRLLDPKVQRAGRTTCPMPVYAVRVPKAQADDDYQSALAQGKYNADRRRVYRITGADRILIRDSLDGKTLDLTEQAERLLGVDHVEPEGAFTLDGHLHVAVQTDSVARRRITYLPLKW